jgi:hypothetical protein
MGKLRFGSGSVSVEMDDTLDRMVRAAINKAQPGALREVERATEELYAQAVAQWPVKTGTSRAGLRREVLVSQGLDRIRGRVFNDVDYAKYIRPRALYGADTAFVAYLRRPAKEIAERLTLRLLDLIPRALIDG